MERHLRTVASLALALALLTGIVSTGTAAELVVSLINVSDTVPAAQTPAVGAHCAEALKVLKVLGLRIIDVKGASGLVYTMQRDPALGRPAAVAVIFCSPADPPEKS